MVLIGVRGRPQAVNRKLMLYALSHTPALVLDCSTSANPHAFPFIPVEQFSLVSVIEIELLYLLRDVLKVTPQLAQQCGAQCIIVTTFARLFHYQDEAENQDLLNHIWELVRTLADQYPVFVGIHPKHETQEVAWDTQFGVNA